MLCLSWNSVLELYSAKPFAQTDINGLLKVKKIAQTFLHKKNEQFAQKDSLSKLPVKEIAERCGYENKYFFYRIKKNTQGKLPADTETGGCMD